MFNIQFSFRYSALLSWILLWGSSASAHDSELPSEILAFHNNLVAIEDALYLYGGGIINRSTNGGVSWNEVFRFDSGVRRLMECDLSMYTWNGRDTFAFYIKSTYQGSIYFVSTDALNWMRSGENYIPSVALQKIHIGSLCDKNGLSFVSVYEFWSSRHAEFELGICEIPTEKADDSVQISLYRRDTTEQFWSRVVTVPKLVKKSAFDIHKNYPYGFIKLDYLSKERVNIAFIESLGMYYSKDSGITWNRVSQVATDAKIIGFVEWRDQLVIVYRDGRVQRIPKGEAFG